MVIFWDKIIQSDFLLKFGSILVVVVSGCDQALHITVTIIFAGTGPCANLFFSRTTVFINIKYNKYRYVLFHQSQKL